MFIESESNDDRGLASQFSTSISGSLSSASDVDWFTFENPIPTRTDVTFNWGAAKSGWWKFELLDENFKLLNARTLGPAVNSGEQELTFTVYGYSVGDYFIRIYSDFAPMYSGAKYTIELEQPSFSLGTNKTSFTEGETILMSFLEDGWKSPSYPTYYTIEGIDSNDITIPLKGIIDRSGPEALLEIPTAIDKEVEGTETLSIDVGRYTGGVAGSGYSSSYISLGKLTVDVNDSGKESDDQDPSGGNQKLDESLGPSTIQINTLSVIVDLFGEILYLKDLVESITSETHTIEYSGIVFNWSEVDAFVTTVIRNGEFTEEFAKEIADAYPSVTGISYTTAVTLVGSSEIEDVLIAVAGADGDFIG